MESIYKTLGRAILIYGPAGFLLVVVPLIALDVIIITKKFVIAQTSLLLFILILGTVFYRTDSKRKKPKPKPYF